MEKRKWSKAEKLEVLKEADEKGVEVTLRKYGIYPSTLYDWREKVKSGGESGLDRKKHTPKNGEYLVQLESENSRLKRLVAEMALEIDLYKELGKKKHP